MQTPAEELAAIDEDAFELDTAIDDAGMLEAATINEDEIGVELEIAELLIGVLDELRATELLDGTITVDELEVVPDEPAELP